MTDCALKKRYANATARSVLEEWYPHSISPCVRRKQKLKRAIHRSLLPYALEGKRFSRSRLWRSPSKTHLKEEIPEPSPIIHLSRSRHNEPILLRACERENLHAIAALTLVNQIFTPCRSFRTSKKKSWYLSPLEILRMKQNQTLNSWQKATAVWVRNTGRIQNGWSWHGKRNESMSISDFALKSRGD